MADLHDLSCVVHLHSTHSDGTGTVPEIMRAAHRSQTDVVLLTDHDSLGALHDGEEGWYPPSRGAGGSSLLLVGQEISPVGGNHYLAFGLEREVDHRDLSPREIVAEVERRGGFGFAAHPFSEGSERFPWLSSLGCSMAWDDLDCLDGLELWSFVADNGQALASVREGLRFAITPERQITHPPTRNLELWDRMTLERRVTAIGGLDAHQFGVRIAGRAIRAMGYARSFRQLRTHVLAAGPPTGVLKHDRRLVLGALRAGRCYIAAHAVAPAHGFRFFAERLDGERAEMGEQAPPGGWTIRADLPRRARLVLRRDGGRVDEALDSSLEHRAEQPGVYRLEAYLHAHGAERTWILSNPLYLR